MATEGFLAPASGIGRAGVVLSGALLCWGAWVVDVFWLNGGGRGVTAGHSAVVPLIALVVAWTSSIVGGTSVSARRRWVFVAVVSAFIYVAAVVARALVIDILSGSVFSMSVGHFVGLAVVAAALALVLAGAGHGLLRAGFWVWPRVGLALMAAMPLALVTIQVIPGFGGQTGDAAAIEMGYPVFWFALLVPLSVWKRAG